MMNWQSLITLIKKVLDDISTTGKDEDLTQKQIYFCTAFSVISKVTVEEYKDQSDYYDVMLKRAENLSFLRNREREYIETTVLDAWRELGLPVEFFIEAKKLHDEEMLHCKKVKDIPESPTLESILKAEDISPFIEKKYTPFQDFFGKSASFSEIWSKLPKFLEQEYAVAKHNKTRLPVFSNEIYHKCMIAYESTTEEGFKVLDDRMTYWGVAACIYLIAGEHEFFPELTIKTIKQLKADNFGEQRYSDSPILGAALTARLRQRGIKEQATLASILIEDIHKAQRLAELCSTETLLFGFIPIDLGYIPTTDGYRKITPTEKAKREEIFKSLLPFFPGLKEARYASREKFRHRSYRISPRFD